MIYKLKKIGKKIVLKSNIGNLYKLCKYAKIEA